MRNDTLAAAAMVWLLAQPCLAGEAAPNDYAYGARVEGAQGGSLFEFELADAVYMGVTRGGLADICMFNGAGEMIPFSISAPMAETAQPEEKVDLPVFPLFREKESVINDISFQMTIGKDGAIVSLAGSRRGQEEKKPYAYIADASAHGRPVTMLEMDWSREEAKGLFGVNVEGSADLRSWSALATGAILMDMEYAGHTLARRLIPLPADSGVKYLKLSASGAEPIPALARVTATLLAGKDETARKWAAAPEARDGAQKNDYLIDLQGYYPADRARVKLPQSATIARAAFFSRQRPGERWQPRADAAVYNLKIGGLELNNPEIRFPEGQDRYWMMRIEKDGGGLGQGAPAFEFGWLPHRVTFSARGTAPYTLAWGSGRNPLCQGRTDGLVGPLREREEIKSVIKTVSTGGRFILGGEEVLRPKKPGYDWKAFLLWAALALGVAAMGAMSWSLYMQMSRAKGGGTPGG